MILSTTIHPRHTSRDGRIRTEHAKIAARYLGSARELFPPLVERMLASRPVIGERVIVPKNARPDAKGVIRTSTVPIYGKPTFRNRIIDGVIV